MLASPLAIAQAPPAIPAKAGEAAGTVQAGKVTVNLKYAYAMGPLDAPADPVYQIVLTDAPIPPEALAAELKNRGGQRLLRTSKVSGISMLVDSKGFLRNIVPFVDEMRGSPMLASAGDLDKFAMTPAGITGQGKKGLADKGGQGWSYAASFNAALIKP